MAIIQVGEFTLNDGILSGPADYMREQGNALVDAMLDHADLIFNTTAHLSPNVETAILVRLQTDFAGWLGLKQVEGWLHPDNRRRRLSGQRNDHFTALQVFPLGDVVDTEPSEPDLGECLSRD